MGPELLSNLAPAAIGAGLAAPIGLYLLSRKTTRRIPWQVGNVTIDLQPMAKQSIHVAIGGTSGLGKSSVVLPILDLPIGVLIIALDNTYPIATRLRELDDGIEWSNEPDWPIAWNMLSGPPALVSEGLIAGWPRSDGDSGHFRRIVRMRIWDRLEEADRDGEVRSLPMIIEHLLSSTSGGDGQVGRACRDWATKLAAMYRMLGPAIGGPGDLDLVDAMRSKKKVLMRLNRFLNPEDAPTLGGMILVHARRVAQSANVPFVIILEEAGQMGAHQEQIVPLAQAGRDRDVPMLIINQNLSQMPAEVSNNISVWVSFAQELRREIDFAAHHLRLERQQLYRESFPGKGVQQGRGWCYVRAPGVPTKLVKIKKYEAKTKKASPIILPSESTVAPASRYKLFPALNAPVVAPWRPALPEKSVSTNGTGKPDWVGLDPDLIRWWSSCKRTGYPTPLWSPERGVWWDEKGCLEWLGSLSKHKSELILGRPRSNRGKQSVTVYLELAKAAGRNTEPTWDHCCDYQVCCDPDHGYACSIAENNANRRTRDAMLERAWLDRYGQVPEWWANRHYQRVCV